MAHAGQDMYKDWTDFTVYDIMKQVGLYALDGIETYPRIEMEFKIHDEDQLMALTFVTKYLVLHITKHILEGKCLNYFCCSISTPLSTTEDNSYKL